MPAKASTLRPPIAVTAAESGMSRPLRLPAAPACAATSPARTCVADHQRHRGA